MGLATKEPERLFGTDGVRGCANYPPMTVEMALALGRAAGMVFRRNDEKHRVVIGKDTRLSCYMFENALVAGLCSMGVDTLMVGPLPTPGVAYITRAYRADAGIVISASHNPYYDNGIKFFSPEGFKLDDALEQEIEQVVAQQGYLEALPSSSGLGKNYKIEDAQGRYIEFVKASYPREGSLAGLSVVTDCANGATYRVAPLALEELGADVYSMGDQPDGLNINAQCGALYPEEMARTVVERRADVGIAFDGDGDRLMMSDEKGNLVDGDAILAMCARVRKDHDALAGNKVVGTVMTNLGTIHSLKSIGIELIQAPVGDRYVLQEMLKHGAQLGGEQSGHIIFLRHNTTGDGLVSALQVLRLMKQTGKPLSELASWVERYPQTLLNVKVTKKPPLDSLKGVHKAVADIEATLKEKGRVLVRYSGTEMICRVMVEGPSQAEIEKYAEQIGKVIREEIG